MGSRYDEEEELEYLVLRQNIPANKTQYRRKDAESGGWTGSNRQYAAEKNAGVDRRGMGKPGRTGQGRRFGKANRKAALARRKRRIRRQKRVLAVLLCVLLAGFLFAIRQLRREQSTLDGQAVFMEQEEGGIASLSEEKIQGIAASQFNRHPDWTEDFLTISEYSRPGDALEEVNNIFVHYTANPNTSAAQNRSYFENLKDMHDVPGASAHFIIGIDGEILQIIPLDEIAYAVKTRNEDSISIECCYRAENGQFTQETYDSLITLLAWLTDTYDLDTEDILRHYDCGGKKCPLYYVEHEDAWVILKQDVANARK